MPINHCDRCGRDTVWNMCPRCKIWLNRNRDDRS